MIYGYIRVSTIDQNLESQKNLISRYLMEKKLSIDEWIELEMSSRKSARQRKIEELIQKLEGGDMIIASELSRLGRSIKEVLSTVEKIVEQKKSRLILVKQNLDVDPNNKKDVTNKILITIFSMMAELERDFISERTKEGLRARKERGIKLGKPKGVIQASMYDKDREKIFHLYELGVPVNTIIKTHLKYGKPLSLRIYIKKRHKPAEK
jgi:DNA invertase Pin-like site-specific DNA recombinase